MDATEDARDLIIDGLDLLDRVSMTYPDAPDKIFFAFDGAEGQKIYAVARITAVHVTDGDQT